jgi:carbamoyl-phosphate synthase large subunit
MTAIAVSGAGGAIGQSIIKALAPGSYRVVALDSSPLGAGMYTTGTAYTIPMARSFDFVNRVLEICSAEGVDIFFPGLDPELAVVSDAVDEFLAAGVYPVVSSPEVVAIADNKYRTYTALRAGGIPVPYTVDMADYPADAILPAYPFILKRREGGCSADVYAIRSRAELDAIDNLCDFVAQEYIDGADYTCGSVTLDDKCQGVIVMRRTLRHGDTHKCFSVRDEGIEACVRDVMELIKPHGPCNVQLRVRDGVPYVFEINARCSGTTAARALCGFNEPLMIADWLTQGTAPQYEIREATVLRYWQELLVDNEDVAELGERGVLHRGGYRTM